MGFILGFKLCLVFNTMTLFDVASLIPKDVFTCVNSA